MTTSTNTLFYPKDISDWHNWLRENHINEKFVWLVFYSKKSGKPSITWSEAVDVALCFGWIDSKKIKIDKNTSHQYFTKRKANSTWSKINKLKVEKLHMQGMMAEAGYKAVEIAKNNGSWYMLDDIEDLVVPNDLKMELNLYPAANENFKNFSKSAKKSILYWIKIAKKTETRIARIKLVAELADKNLKPKSI